MTESGANSNNENTMNAETRLQLAALLRSVLLDTEKYERTVGQSGTGLDVRSKRFKEPIELVYLVLSKFKYILLAAVLGAFLLGAYAFMLMSPTYSSTAKIYITGQNSSSILADLQIGSYLTMDYQEVFKTWEVHEMVRKQLDLPYTYEEMQSMLKITNPSDTRVLYITVENTDPQLATNIANAYAEAAKVFIQDTMASEEPSTFSVALVPSKATGIGRTSYVIVGFVAGLLIAAAVILLKELLNNKPRTPEDIAQYAEIPTLAIVPATKVKIR